MSVYTIWYKIKVTLYYPFHIHYHYNPLLCTYTNNKHQNLQLKGSTNMLLIHPHHSREWEWDKESNSSSNSIFYLAWHDKACHGWTEDVTNFWHTTNNSLFYINMKAQQKLQSIFYSTLWSSSISRLFPCFSLKSIIEYSRVQHSTVL